MTKASNKLINTGVSAYAELNSHMNTAIDVDQVLDDAKACDAALETAMRSLE